MANEDPALTAPKRLMWASGVGTGIAALCCFTPLGVIALGLLGAGGAVLWLDFVAIPALILCAALFVAAWLWWRRRAYKPTSS